MITTRATYLYLQNYCSLILGKYSKYSNKKFSCRFGIGDAVWKSKSFMWFCTVDYLIPTFLVIVPCSELHISVFLGMINPKCEVYDMIWNVRDYRPVYTAWNIRRPESLITELWETQIIIIYTSTNFQSHLDSFEIRASAPAVIFKYTTFCSIQYSVSSNYSACWLTHSIFLMLLHMTEDSLSWISIWCSHS